MEDLRNLGLNADIIMQKKKNSNNNNYDNENKAFLDF